MKGDKKLHTRKKSAITEEDLLLPKKMMLPLPNEPTSPNNTSFLKIQKVVSSSSTLFVSD